MGVWYFSIFLYNQRKDEAGPQIYDKLIEPHTYLWYVETWNYYRKKLKEKIGMELNHKEGIVHAWPEK